MAKTSQGGEMHKTVMKLSNALTNQGWSEDGLTSEDKILLEEDVKLFYAYKKDR